MGASHDLPPAASIARRKRPAYLIHDDTPLGPLEFGVAVQAQLLQAAAAYAAVLLGRRPGEDAGQLARAERELSRCIERELVICLLHDVSGLGDRRWVFEQMKAEVSEHPHIQELGLASLDPLWQRIDAGLAPLWRDLAADYSPDATRTLLAERFASDTPAQREWHFVVSAGQRLHLQSRTSAHRVWLEREGRRCFEPEAPLDAAVFGPLEAALSEPEPRQRLERRWALHMARNGWLRIDWVSEDAFLLCAYPDQPGSFRRHVRMNAGLRRGAREPGPRPLRPRDVRALPYGVLTLWEHRILLPELLWGPSRLRQITARCVRTECPRRPCEPLELAVELYGGASVASDGLVRYGRVRSCPEQT